MSEQVDQTNGREPRKQAVRDPNVAAHRLQGDDTYPNNATVPLLLYKGVVKLPPGDLAHIFEELFRHNGWHGTWRDGIYAYHHYHSTAHEVLGVYRGGATVQLGGPGGITVTLEPGDVVVIPAGVAHKRLSSSGDFGVVGAYPRGQQWDMNTGEAGERPRADENIARVPVPATDPVYGASGPLVEHWVAS
jgi:uncharacterized protein YjlB